MHRSASNREDSKMPDVLKSASIEVFFSYSHKDEGLRDELSNHLAMLQRQDVITGWHDRRIGAGQEWANEIDRHLDTANVILLLISSDFLASNYCYDVEVKRAMERHEASEARVIPVILRPVDWHRAPFGKLQPLPTDGKAVMTWQNRDEAFFNVAEGIRKAVDELILGRIDYLIEKFNNAESLKNWPNVCDFGERILRAIPDHDSIRGRTAAAYVNRWSSRFGAINFVGYVEVKKRKNETLEQRRQLLIKISRDLDRAIQLDPKNAEFYFLRGSVIYHAPHESCELNYKFDQDTSDFARAIEIDPKNARYYYARALRTQSRDEKAAVRDFERALELGYEEREITSQLASLYQKMGNYEGALKRYERLAQWGDQVAEFHAERLRSKLRINR
jgi:tetratricopeptide (TPR) repeat protein